MCGIAGAYSSKGIAYQSLICATDEMAHRGPDSKGYYTNEDETVFLGHRRLSIIDLSGSANQPMVSADGRYTMVYNGELYNFEALRHKLPRHEFKTHSDTEVILELFVKFGTDCFAWFNGMFALSIYDSQAKKLYLSRDQVGIKPLYYYRDEQQFVFASELKVIQNHCKDAGIELAVDRDAVAHFLHLGFIPQPYSIYQKVFKFPAAHYAVLDTTNGHFNLTQFWNAASHVLHNPITNEQEALSRYRDILFGAVEGQMIADVPLGTFLSGGIDSSLVTAVASKLSDQKINTFSIGFNEAAYDESEHAQKVASSLATNHHLFKVSINDILEVVPSLLKVYDEPFGDSSAFPTMLVSQMARKNVTVTLSGDGGDEMFQGYGMYAWANRLNKPVVKAFRKPFYAFTRLMNDRYKRGGELFNYPDEARLHTHIFSQEQYFFSEQELHRLLLTGDFDFAVINDTSEVKKNITPAERQAYWDFEHYLQDDLLVKVDRASMQYSLETRVPLLDINVVEFALNLDYNLKVKDGYGTKYLMKKLLYEMVPRGIFERPKRGFSMPLKQWLKGPLKYMVDQYLAKSVVEQYGYVSYNEVNKLLSRFNNGEDYLYGRIWLLVVLHWWLSDKL
jgi:asparagine synthase (glutamine-hydrolysing)